MSNNLYIEGPDRKSVEKLMDQELSTERVSIGVVAKSNKGFAGYALTGQDAIDFLDAYTVKIEPSTSKLEINNKVTELIKNQDKFKLFEELSAASFASNNPMKQINMWAMNRPIQLRV